MTVESLRGSISEHPLSYGQRAIWYLCQLEPLNSAYNVTLPIRIHSEVDATALRRAFQRIADRHAPLRATFPSRDGVPVQRVEEHRPVDFETISGEGWDSQELGERLRRIADRPFDLEHGPVFRVTLIRRAATEHLLVIGAHHLVTDMWSTVVLMEELGAIYPAERSGTIVELPRLPLQYAEFVEWQRTMLEGAEGERLWTFWKDSLAGDLPPLGLQTDKPRPTIQTFAGETHRFRLDEDITHRLKALARSERITFYALLLATFQVLLHRYSGQPRILVGSPVAARSRPEFESLIGYFVNPLVFGADFSEDSTAREFLHSTGRAVLSALEHQDFPFPLLVERLNPPRDPRRSPLFQAMFSFERPHRPESRDSPGFLFGEEGRRRSIGGLDVEPFTIETKGAQFELTLAIHETGGALLASFEYNSGLFDRTTAARMEAHFRTLLDSILENPSCRISSLSMLPSAERRRVELEFSGIGSPPVPPGTVLERIARAGSLRPEAVAIEGTRETVTFAELERRASRIACRLRARGLRPGAIVGIVAGRSPAAIAGMLGVLQAGATYVSLDPSYPTRRLALLIADASPAFVFAQEGTEALLRGIGVADIQSLESRGHPESDEPDTPAPAPPPEPGHAAYLAYTSGSTGSPNGVLISHHALLNHAVQVARAYRLQPDDRVLQFASLGFDVAAEEIYPSLLSGASVVLRPERDFPSIREFARMLSDRGITVVNLPATYWHQWADELDEDPALLPERVRLVVVGSERVRPESVTRWKRSAGSGVRLVNAYGPTEATITATLYDTGTAPLSPNHRDSANVAIGRPIPGAHVHVLDSALQPVPIGVPGEAFIGGVGVALGYLRRSELDARRFVRDRKAAHDGARLYRTGDLVRWRPDGNLEFLGRVDDQVKVRGFRVEPAEIESVLRTHPAVREAAVVAWEHRGSQKLAAYVVESLPIAPGELRAFLADRLPEYMVPATFVGMDALPRTTGGKVARNDLPLPKQDPEATRTLVPPRTPIEETLATIWAETLGLPRVGVFDNFFSLGGDSILSIQIVALARRKGLRITTRAFFQRPTIAALAEAATESGSVLAEQGLVSGEVPLIPIQRWLLEQSAPDPHHDNQSVLLTLRDPPDLHALEQAVGILLRHHDALRHRFVRDGSGWRQFVGDPDALVPFTRIGVPDFGERFEAACAAVQASLDLERGPVFRSVLFEREQASRGEPARFLLAAHHLVVDGVSWRILLEDLAAAYEQIRCGSGPDLPPKTTSFKAWAERLTEYSRTPAALAEGAFWTDPLRSRPRPVPTDRNALGEDPTCRSPGIESSTRTLPTRLSREETSALLHQATVTYGARINDLLLAALSRALESWGGPGPWLIDLEGHGREEIFEDVDLSRTTGWFTTMFPVLLDAGAARGREDAFATVDAVRRVLRSIPNHGIGYGVLRFLSARGTSVPDGSVPPTAEICFNYLGQLDGMVTPAGPFSFAGEPLQETRSPRAPRTHLLDVNAFVAEGQLQITWSYSSDRHERASVERLARLYCEELCALAVGEGIRGPRALSPEEFPLAGLGAESLERLFGDDPGVEDVYPLSPLQQGMLFHSLDQGDPAAYVEQLSWRIDGEPDEDLLRAGWSALVARHSAFRTEFLWDGLDQPLQVVRRKAELPWESIDYRSLEKSEREARLEEYLRAERSRPFHLSRAPLLRFALIRTDDDVHHVVLTHHHLILDGWSIPLLLDELATFVQSRKEGREAALPPAAAYRDYIAWLQKQDGSASEAFWRERLRGFRTATALRLDAPDTDPTAIEAPGDVALDDVYRERRRELSSEVTAALDAFARCNALTVASLVRAAWAILLSRYSGEEDVLFGSVASGRPADLREAESTVGLFINTVPLRLRVPEGMPVLPWLHEIQDRQFEALRYEHTPLIDAHRWSEVPQGKPLFETILVFENYPIEARIKLGALGTRDLRAWDKTNYPISLAAAPGRRLSLQIVYDRHRFSSDAIERMLGHVEALLQSIPANPEGSLRDLTMLPEEERRQTLVEWNRWLPHAPDPAAQPPSFDYPDRCVHELFEEEVARRPEAIALVHESRTLTYRALNEAADVLANRLRALGIQPESPVAICMERSPEAIIAMLAVLKSGGAYVPIDPAYPADRLRFMLEDLDTPVLLTQRRVLSRLPASAAAVFCVDDADPFTGAAHDVAPQRAKREGGDGGPDRLAYIMYTSGSTGRPKGVEVTHRGIVRLVRNTNWVRFDEDEVVLQVVSLSFDPSALEIWGCLLNGGRLVLHPSRTPSLEEIGEALREHCVTTVVLITGLFPLMVDERLDDLRGLRQLIVGGDAMPAAAARRVLEAIPGLRLINAYGPTEGTVVACAHTATDASEIGRVVPIGRPIANSRIYLLDKELRPVPAGVPGELFIAGDGVARGYHHSENLTAERFLADPFGEAGATMYRTGDLARHQRDGTIEFLGRVDEQVKVRGFRVEPGEVEAVLGQHPSVRACAVSAPRGPLGDRKLVAHVAADPITSSDLRAFLRTKLPEFMVPSAFVISDRLPLTANGKVDRDALLSNETEDRGGTTAKTPPGTETERIVAAIWGEVLRASWIDVHDDFFESGGDSLIAMQLVSRLRSRFGAILTLRDLFKTPTVYGIATLIEAASQLVAAAPPATELVAAVARGVSDAGGNAE